MTTQPTPTPDIRDAAGDALHSFGQSRTMTVDFRPSKEFSLAELASLFTAAYHGYFIPFAVDETQLRYLVDVFDLDLSRSLVAVEHQRPIGLANLGRRGERTWLGGVGVVPDHRGSGVGESLTRRLLDQAREAGAREMVLEVIVENRAAIRCTTSSASSGRVSSRCSPSPPARRSWTARRRRPWASPGHSSGHGATRTSPGSATMTRSRLLQRDPAPEAMVAGDAAAIYRVTGDTVGLVQAAGDEPGLGTILASLRARGSVSALNYPSGGEAARGLRAAGAKVSLRQYEMVKRL